MDMDLMTGTAAVLLVFYMILALVFYHKVFVVLYSDLFHGLMKELVTAFIVGVIMTGITLAQWKISVAIILIIAIVLVLKSENNTKRIIIGVSAVIIIAILVRSGIQLNKQMDENANTEEETSDPKDRYEDLRSDFVDLTPEPVLESTELSDFADYTEDELAKALGVEKNATGMYPSDNESNFMCGDGKVYMIRLNQSHQNDSQYTLFGVKLGEAASNINDKISAQFDFIDSYYIDGGKRDVYVNKKTGYGLAIDYDTNSSVISVSYVKEYVMEEYEEDNEIDSDDDEVKENDEQPEIIEEEKEENSSEYILPDSSSKLLKAKDLKGLSSAQCRLAKNEIYARHGRLFQDQSLQNYFDNKSWYSGYIEPEDFDESVFSKIEKKNVKLLVKYENKG